MNYKEAKNLAQRWILQWSCWGVDSANLPQHVYVCTFEYSFSVFLTFHMPNDMFLREFVLCNKKQNRPYWIRQSSLIKFIISDLLVRYRLRSLWPRLTQSTADFTNNPLIAHGVSNVKCLLMTAHDVALLMESLRASGTEALSRQSMRKGRTWPWRWLVARLSRSSIEPCLRQLAQLSCTVESDVYVIDIDFSLNRNRIDLFIL